MDYSKVGTECDSHPSPRRGHGGVHKVPTGREEVISPTRRVIEEKAVVFIFSKPDEAGSPGETI